MKWLLIVLIILLFLIILIILTKITIHLTYRHHNDDDHLIVELRALFGLIRYQKSIPLIKVDDDSPSIIVKGKGPDESESQSKITSHDVLKSLKNYRDILEHVFQLHTIVKKFLKKVSVKKLEWYSAIGIGDAANTGTGCGALWAIKGSIVGLISHYFNVEEMPKLMVYPNFQQVIVQTELSCMFQFRIGNAMLAGIKLVKFWKGGRPRLMTKAIVSNEEQKLYR